MMMVIQLLNCCLEDVASLRSWMFDRKYQSHDIINEQIKIMAGHVLNTLITDIKNSGIFSIIADETRDISGIKQFVVCIRWVDNCCLVHEDLIT